jgi:hypothetical protein
MSVLAKPMDGILAALADVPDQRMRLQLVCRASHVTFREIEKAQGLSNACISAYVNGQRYAFPKLKHGVTRHLAETLGESVDDVAAFLFPEEARHEAPPK